ncbi:quinol:cytochrome C oxidoreductase [Planctomycetales bacterium ZRK34]|nr:quinol:cytochrome C oxidoreductase [Planctomycetales bacterium ZRK34]
MSAHALGQLDANERRTLDAFGKVGLVASLIIGAVGLLAALALSAGDWTLFGHAYLTGFMYFLTVSVAALFFVIIQHLTRAGWSSTIRRIAELMAMNLPILGILVIPILVLHGGMYEWVHADPSDPVLGPKLVWLNTNFFVIRVVIYFVVLISLAYWFYSHSIAQDTDGDLAHTMTMQRYSGLMLVIFAITGSAVAFDLVMSLNPEWYSTMYAVYLFAGGLAGFFAWMILSLRLLQSHGIMTSSVNQEHYHDLGKWLFGFVFFWSYVAFSQYMLQWYANIPEETAWFAQRGATTHDAVSWTESGPWPILALVLLFGHSLIPFPALLSRWCKRILGVLTFWAAWMAVFHLVDMIFVIMPAMQMHETESTFTMQIVIAVCGFVGIGGFWFASLFWWAGARSVMPLKDPRIAESLAHENY